LAGANDPYVGMEILGQYRIERKLGEGGMGMVYLADQPAMARKAAIKILRPEIASEDQLERFQREAQTLSHIDHPHIIKVYNFGTLDQGERYIAMEFVQGQEMDKVIDQTGRMEWHRALDIITAAADALVEAHSKGIVHRDLKPENIMLCERRGTTDYVKVMDFGIAKVLENSQELQSSATVMGVIHGTPQYMSPEQARGESVDHRSDIYSLGIVLYVMLTGALPIQSNTLVGFIIAHQQDPPAPLASHGVEVPKELEAILFKMLEKRVEDRFQSMQEVLAALRAITAPKAVAAPKHKNLVVLLLVLIIALLGAGGAAYYLGLFGGRGQQVVKTGLPPGVVEASDNKPAPWIKRTPPTGEKTYVVGTGVAAIKGQARDQAASEAAVKVLEKAAALVMGDDLETKSLEAWLKVASKRKAGANDGRILAEAIKKAALPIKLGESDSDYWELRRPKSGASAYHYWRLFSAPVNDLRRLAQEATKGETFYGMRVIPMYPLLAPLAEQAEGVILAKVKKGGVADREGVQQFDLVLRVNGQRVESPKDFVAKVRKAVATGKKTGAPMTFEGLRLNNGEAAPVTVELTKLK